jgi:hypothetical protein
MYTLTDRLQLQACNIKEGQHQLTAAHQAIVDWISKQFDVTALDFCCERRETTKGLPQQLVHVIVETVDNVKKMQADRASSKLVAERFQAYFKSPDAGHHPTDPTKSNVFPAGTNPFPEVVVTYRPLKALTEKLIQEMRNDDKFTILKAFESVWTLSQSVVFYYTDAQIKENQASGISAKISALLNQVERKYGSKTDTPYYFDSKESFDRDYESKWHYYWK